MEIKKYYSLISYKLFLFIFSGIIFIPDLIKGFLKGDSFYALALKRFYCRQLRIINNKHNNKFNDEK